MMYRYSHDYFPPAPILGITVIGIAENLSVGPLTAIVDSGADGTIIPLKHLDQIHAPSTVEMFIRSQWGERRRVIMYLVDVRIGDLTLPGIEVIGDEISQDVVLGRNILNRLRVLLDGPGETLEVLG